MAAARIAKDPAKFFIRKDVHDLLVKVTGFDMSKIFKPDFNPALKNSEIQLLTQSQLEAVNKNFKCRKHQSSRCCICFSNRNKEPLWKKPRCSFKCRLS
jgi:hypothetical protein